ncbi:AAA family ATPase [Burkholderia sp. Cy-637]|uniref:McrB family protein n=1 Tax=Burkholderia sp. Cy-637 TaxID=2608327 RepID=UPI00141F27F8|nr:AAA family ATPase [Burkholderia sp. Cy-637]NIF89420.1 AAA domain-containing protein [Burkholderia sp. Cy-637]
MSRKIPNKPNSHLTYQAAEKFKDVALLNQQSLFLQDKTLWVPEHFEPLLTHYVQDPIVGDDERGSSFWQKLPHQIGRCAPKSVALAAEIYWVLTLASSLLKPKSKLARIDEIWAMADPTLPPIDKSSFYLQEPTLEGVGSTGTAYNLLLWMELAYGIKLFKALAEKPRAQRDELLSDPWAFATWLDEMDETGGRQFYHILTHALFPDHFERIFSEGGKEQIARDSSLGVPKSARASRPERDKALVTVRERLEKEHPETTIDYYIFPPLLKRDETTAKKKRAQSGAIGSTPGMSGSGNTGVGLDPGGLEDDSDEPQDGADVSSNRAWKPRNRIFFGPPGSGKTRAMELIRAYRYMRGESVEFVSFHPSYSYEDFVEGYRPAPGQGGRLSEKPVAGPFRRFCESAHKHPDVRHTLFVDEINRANVAKVFGELITLLEPSKRCTPTPDLDFSEIRSAVRLQYSGDMLAVPANLDIIASMNTADRSVQSMDRALRRRFEFIETAADPNVLPAEKIDGVDLRALLKAINDRIEFLIDGDHAIGHALLMGVRNLWDLRRAISRRVIPLLQEYFFEDLSRAKLALTGSSKPSIFFDERKLDATELFDPSTDVHALDSRKSIRAAADQSLWTAADFIRLYLRGDEAQAAIDSLPPAVAVDEEDGVDEEFEDLDELEDPPGEGANAASGPY